MNETHDMSHDMPPQSTTSGAPGAREAAPRPAPWQRHPISFTGTASEYFRIWIVNTFLTVITFGIYAAWAKVRTRQYFYNNTRVLGDSFEYLADPVRILKGNLLVGAGFALFVTADLVSPLFKLGVMAVIGLLMPLLIHKSLRFYAHNTAFRNIRFRFTGSLKEAYITYLFFPLLIPLTLGVMTPSWLYRQKRYFFRNFAFGDTSNRFRGDMGYFYKHYCVGVLLGAAVLMLMMTMPMIVPLVTAPLSQARAAPSQGILIGIMVVSYLVAILGFSVVDQYLYAQFTNHCWRRSRLGAIRFDSRLDAGKLVKIRITNVLAIVFSLGLLAPWAKIRRSRYVLSRLCLGTRGDMPLLVASPGREESALGDSAVDFLDIDIGF